MANNTGWELIESKSYEKAIETFTEGIKYNDNYRLWNYLGRARAQLESGSINLARADLAIILKSEKENPFDLNRDTYWHLGWISDSQGLSKEEVDHYKKALKYDPSNNELNMTYAYALIGNGEDRKGVGILTELINNGFKSGFVYSNRAMAYINLNELDRASHDCIIR